MADVYDVIVVGCGGMGSGVLAHLAQRGARVLGVDRFHPPHDMGSSHGKTRIIRQAYFEHPDYVPLLMEAYALWSELEREVGRELFRQVGLLQIGPRDGVVVPGVLRSAKEHRLPVEHLGREELTRRFPMFGVEEGEEGVWEPRAGVLWVEECVRAHLEKALRNGAEIWTGTEVDGVKHEDGGVRIRTGRGEVVGRQVLFACGAWASTWMSGVALKVLRKQVHWYDMGSERYRAERGCPMFLVETGEDCYYGFPDLEGQGLKVGSHWGGQVVGDPGAVMRGVDDEDARGIEGFLERRMEGGWTLRETSVCMYTMTRDEHFVLDQAPEDPRCWWMGGFSGHGFKFASVLGKLMSDVMLDGVRDQRLDFLSLARLR